MKVLIELTIDVDCYDGTTMTESEIKREIQEHIEEVFSPDFRDTIIEPGFINVPTNSCWDCISYITFRELQVL